MFPRGEIMREPDDVPDDRVESVVEAADSLVNVLETQLQEAEKRAEGLEAWIDSHLEYGLYGEARINRLQRGMSDAAHVLARGRRGREGRADAQEAMRALLAAELRTQDNDVNRVC